MRRYCIIGFVLWTLLPGPAKGDSGPYPTGLASVQFGDSKKTVFEKITRSEHINFPIWRACGTNLFPQWVDNLDAWGCKDTITLFDKDFYIDWNFSSRDKLYRIVLTTHVTSEESYVPSENNRRQVRELGEQIVKVYTEKYGPPSYTNLNAYPGNAAAFQPIFAEWQFAQVVLTRMSVSRDARAIKRNAKRVPIQFHIEIRDIQEYDLVERQSKEKQKQEDEQKALEMRKAKEFL